MARASVAFWHARDGWGAIEDPDRPGVGFVHFSQVRTQGYRSLAAGQTVEYEWADDLAQDGCQWRVAWARPLGQ